MTIALTQHQVEMEGNLRAWSEKPLLRQIYSGFYDRIVSLIDASLPGAVIEVGSGIGNLKGRVSYAIATDLFSNPWLDVVCDGYELPFETGAVSHLILFDVFHHLRAPMAFLREAARILRPEGRVILFEPYISACSYPIYGLLHHEPMALTNEISVEESLPGPRDYYAAQGNATRLFFGNNGAGMLRRVTSCGWSVFHAERFAAFAYLLSGGFRRRAAYPRRCLGVLQGVDRFLSRWPRLFGGRCLVGLRRLPK